MGILTIVFVILVACDSSDESNVPFDNQSQNNNATQNTNDDSSNADSTENTSSTDTNNKGGIDTGNNDTNEKADTPNNVLTNEEGTSTNNTASLKEEYLKKLNIAKKEMEEMRENPIDDTTFAMKKVEGDIYDVWDGLLNEVYDTLETQLPPEEMDQLRKEQREWIDYRDNTAKEASLKYKGGTMEQLEYVRVENNLTVERCFELVEDYMK